MTDQRTRALLLVGHGGVATDCPPQVVSEWKRLEAARHRVGGEEPCSREAELDGILRGWPRTPDNDPYYFGVSRLREELQALQPGVEVRFAFNEFAGPSVAEALDGLVEAGAQDIRLVTTMLTPGGFHSECEIPQEVARAREKYPEVRFHYVWPVPEADFARFLPLISCSRGVAPETWASAPLASARARLVANKLWLILVRLLLFGKSRWTDRPPLALNRQPPLT